MSCRLPLVGTACDGQRIEYVKEVLKDFPLPRYNSSVDFSSEMYVRTRIGKERVEDV